MTPRPIHLIFQLAIPTSIFLFTSASSCDAGDRASSGECPIGEVCDPATEEGLHFQGARFAEGLFDSGDVKTMAIGGTQNVRVFDVDDAGNHVPLDLAFEAAVDGEATIEATDGHQLRLRGATAGIGFLRILSAESGELFDRVSIAARHATGVRVIPTVNIAFAGHTESNLYAPGAMGVLRIDDDQRSALVDESARIRGPIVQDAWDRFRVRPGTVLGLHTLDVSAGELTAATVTIEVARADALELAFGFPEVDRHGKTFLCFNATTDDRAIHVPWRFEADRGNVIPHPLAGCVTIEHVSGDSVEVRAFGDGLVTSLAVPVVDSDEKREPEAAAMHRRGLAPLTASDTAGERAALR